MLTYTVNYSFMPLTYILASCIGLETIKKTGYLRPL